MQNAPFRSLRLSAQSLRWIRILILKIFNIFLWLKSSCALILNEIDHFSKISKHTPFSDGIPKQMTVPEPGGAAKVRHFPSFFLGVVGFCLLNVAFFALNWWRRGELRCPSEFYGTGRLTQTNGCKKTQSDRRQTTEDTPVEHPHVPSYGATQEEVRSPFIAQETVRSSASPWIYGQSAIGHNFSAN